jgi:poly-gamma-glutamate synthesis protein (capsule biosynthesis protein)
MSTSAVAPRLLGAALCLTMVGCTGESSSSAPDADGRSGSSSASPVPSSRAARAGQPLVLAVHPTHGDLEIGAATARRLIAGRMRTWEALDGREVALRVVRSVPLVSDRDTVAVVPAAEVGPSVRAIRVGGVDPLRRPRRYPLTVDGPTPAAVTTVRVIGDIMLGRGVAAANASADPVAALRPIGGHLAGADLTVGNLESSLSTSGPARQGTDSFAVPPETLTGLAELGVDAVSLANNHTGDFGTGALLETVRSFRGSGVRAFGAGRDLSAALHPSVLTRHGVRFAFIGFNAIGETPRATPGRPGALSVRMPPRTGPLNRADLRAVTSTVRRLDRRVDVVVVLPHWGTQYTHVPEPVQRRVGRRLVDAGADLVVGHGPHVLRGMEFYRGRLIAYSLGNFAGYKVFSLGGPLSTSAILRVTLRGNGAFDTGRIVPTRLVGAGLPALDPTEAAHGVVRTLSRQDFGARGVKVSRDGILSR